jgi:hypothetical protein
VWTWSLSLGHATILLLSLPPTFEIDFALAHGDTLGRLNNAMESIVMAT